MKTLFLNIILAVLYAVAGKLSFELSSLHEIITIGIFIPEGISLAFALYFGKRVLPGIFLGQFILAYTNCIEILPALALSMVNTVEALLAIYFFKKFKIDKNLSRLSDIGKFVLLVTIILQVFSAVVGNLALSCLGHIDIDNFMLLTFSWWFGNSMGQLLITPFLLFLFMRHKTVVVKQYIMYALLFTGYIYFIEVILKIENHFLLLSMTIPASILVVAKKDMLYGTLFSIVVTLVTSYSVYAGIGAFHLDSSMDNTINYNLFVLSHIFIVLMVGTLFEEKRSYELHLREKIQSEVAKNKEQQLLMLQQNRLAQMGEMISMIAHQWRQPLNNLSLINQLLISQYNKGKLDIKNLAYFKDNATKQITLMSQTIDDFRNFFKEEKEKEEYAINDTIHNIIDMTKAIYTSSQIHIEFKTQGNFTTVGHPNTMAQAFLNIINNAKDALVESENKEKFIHISITREGKYAQIHIQDNAGGIPQNIIDKIFDPYFSTKLEKNGTGLGLYMTKMIIADEGDANISVCNDVNGAHFTITLKGEWHVDG